VPILFKGHTQCDSVLSFCIIMTKSSCHQALHVSPNVGVNSILQIFWYQIGCISSKNGILHILVHSHMFCIYSETMQCSNDYHTVTPFSEVWLLNWKTQSWVTLTSGSKRILDLHWIWHNNWTVQKNALPCVTHRLVRYSAWGCENCTEQGDGCELLFRLTKSMLHHNAIQNLLPFVST
jgi:hypothetical protein